MGAKSGQYREIEIKLDASAGFQLPPMTDLPGVVRVVEADRAELDAVYLDSADLRLIRHGTTLRRRTGGVDPGWHLKLPLASEGRLEVRRAPGRSERAVPPALKTLVSVHLRGEPLEPVARISTRRAVYQLVSEDGVVLAEVADDEVTGEALGGTMTTDSWREIEVELVHGDRSVLDAARKALTRSGASRSQTDTKLRRILRRRLQELDGTAAAPAANGHRRRPGRESGKGSGKRGAKGAGKGAGKRAQRRAGDVVVAYLTEQLASLTAHDPAVRLDTEDGVHDMRVATRRLRTTLAAFRPIFADGAVEGLREELKWLAGRLGAVRDADVLLQGFRRQLVGQPVELVVGPVRRRVELELRDQRAQARTQLLEALGSERYYTLIGDLERFVTTPPFGDRAGGRADRELRRCVRKACRRVRRARAQLDQPRAGSGPVRPRVGDGLGRPRTGAGASAGPGAGPGSDRDRQVHRIRIAAKRARYAAEASREVAGKDAARLVKTMKRVQQVLGDHQDAVVQRAALRDLAMRGFLAGENTFTLGRMHGLAEAAAAHDLQTFAREWKQTSKRMAAWPG